MLENQITENEKSLYDISIDKISDEIIKKIWKFFMKTFKQNWRYKQITLSKANLKEGVVILSKNAEQKEGVTSMINYDFYCEVIKCDRDIIVLDKEGLRKFVRAWVKKNIPRKKINDDEYVKNQVTTFFKNIGYDDKKGINKILKMIPKKIDDVYAQPKKPKHGNLGVQFGTTDFEAYINYGPMELNFNVHPFFVNYLSLAINDFIEARYTPQEKKALILNAQLPFAYFSYDISKKKAYASMMTLSSLEMSLGVSFIQSILFGHGKTVWERVKYAFKDVPLQYLDPFIKLIRYANAVYLKTLSLFGKTYRYENLGEVKEVINTFEKIISDPLTTVVASRHASFFMLLFNNASHTKYGYLAGIGMAMMDNLRVFDAQGKYTLFTWPPFQNKVKYERKQIRKRLEKAMEFNKKIINKLNSGEKLTEDELNQFKANLVYLGMKIIGYSDCPYERKPIEDNIEESWLALSNYLKNNNPSYKNNIDMYTDGLFFSFMGQLVDDENAIKTGYQLKMYALFKEKPNKTFDSVLELLLVYSSFDNMRINNKFAPTDYWNIGLSGKSFEKMVKNTISKNAKNLPLDDWKDQLINHSTKKGFDIEDERKAYKFYILLETIKKVSEGKIDNETEEILSIYWNYFVNILSPSPLIQENLIRYTDPKYVKYILDKSQKDKNKNEKVEFLNSLLESINKTEQGIKNILDQLSNMHPTTKKGKKFVDKLQKKYEDLLKNIKKNKKMINKELKNLNS